MATTHLTPSEQTGIEVIDDQHERILLLADTLGKVADDGDRDIIGDCINRIVTETLAHMEFEEELMKQAGYPFIKVHKRLHDHFIQRLAEYTQRFDAGEAVAAEMEQFLSSWLHSHFTHEDRDYSPQVLAEMHGLTSPAAAGDRGSWLSRTISRISSSLPPMLEGARATNHCR